MNVLEMEVRTTRVPVFRGPGNQMPRLLDKNE